MLFGMQCRVFFSRDRAGVTPLTVGKFDAVQKFDVGAVIQLAGAAACVVFEHKPEGAPFFRFKGLVIEPINQQGDRFQIRQGD